MISLHQINHFLQRSKLVHLLIYSFIFLLTVFSLRFNLPNTNSYSRKIPHDVFNHLYRYSNIVNEYKSYPSCLNAITDIDIMNIKSLEMMPDRDAFGVFFRACLDASPNLDNRQGIDLPTFCQHDDVKMLLKEDLLSIQVMKTVWNEKFNERSQEILTSLSNNANNRKSPINFECSEINKNIDIEGLTLDETDSYKVLCDVLSVVPLNDDMPMSITKSSLPIEMKYLEKEFSHLSNDKGFISFNTFIAWEEIQALLSDAYCTLDNLRDIWIAVTGSIKSPADITNFFVINRSLDDLVGDGDDDNEGDIEIAEISNEDIIDDININGINEDDQEGGDETLDPWDPAFDPTSVFDTEFLQYIRDYFTSYCNEQGLLSFEVFSTWDDVIQMMKAGQVDTGCLEDLWHEAVIESRRLQPQGTLVEADAAFFSASEDMDAMSNKGSNSKRDKENKLIYVKRALAKKIDLNTFLRMNIRLDILMDEIADALASLTDEDVEQYYRKEFTKLSEGEALLSYQQLLRWQDLAQILENGDVSLKQIDLIWTALPKTPLGRAEMAVKKKKGFGSGLVAQSDGITVDTFIVFNSALEDLESELI